LEDVWVLKAPATNGTYDSAAYGTTFASDNPTLKFSAGSAYKAELRSVRLLSQKVETNTYLLHNTNSLNCISGVISRIPSAHPDFFQSIYPPLTNISIQLFQLINCAWTEVRCTSTNGEGHYCFSGLSTTGATYKVVPQTAGYIYNPEYDNINIAIPQTTPQAYNFTAQ
jgi:hypothetical protein